MSSVIRAGLVGYLDAKLVDQLLEAYQEAKKNFQLGGLRLSEVEGGRFCEAAFRLLQQIAKLPITPLGKQLDTEKLINTLSSISPSSANDSIRMHVPRSLRVIYDIRNKRDAAHLADGIDPNVQDATLVVSVMDWVLAEFVRLYHNVSPSEAQAIVEDVVTRVVPAVEDFGGHLKVLNPKLKAGDFCLVLLHQRGKKGAEYTEMERWVKPSMRRNLKSTLERLVNEKAYLHQSGSSYFITRAGTKYVESQDLLKIGE